jgi:hypothetical protein
MAMAWGRRSGRRRRIFVGRRIFDTDLVAAADGSMCFKRLSIVKCEEEEDFT